MKKNQKSKILRHCPFNNRAISSFKRTPSLTYEYDCASNLLQISNPHTKNTTYIVTNVVHIVAIAIEGTVELHVVGAVWREQVVMVKMVTQVSPTESTVAQDFF
jgi:hypothetical protein